MNKILIIILLILIALPVRGEEQEPMDLSTCIKIASDNSPDLNKARQNIIIAKTQKTQALAGYLPNVQYNAQYSITNAGTTSFSSGGTIINTQPATQSHSTGFVISQTIFDSMKNWYSYKASLAGIEQAEFALKETYNNLALTISQDYFNAVSAKHMVELNEILLNQASKHLEQANANFEAGLAPKSDIFSAQVKVTEAKVNLLDSQNQLRTKMATLKVDMGLNVYEDIAIKGEVYEIQNKPALEESIKKAFENRPELKKMLAQIEYQNRQIDLYTVSVLPQFNIGVNFNLIVTRTPSLPDRSYTAYATFVLPIFDGFSNESKVEGAEATKAGYEADKVNKEKSITLEVANAFYNLETAFAKIDLTSQQGEESRISLEIMEAKYKAGVGSFQEVLDAHVTFNQSMNNFIKAKYDYQIALLSFKKAIGDELP